VQKFTFFKKFNILANDKITLRILEKNMGDNAILPFYYYSIFDKRDNHAGYISVRIGNNIHSYYNGHVGFEVFDGYQGNGYAYEAATLVIEIAKAHGMAKIYLTCTQSNIASCKIFEKLSAKKIEIVKIPKECFFYREGIEMYCIYELEL